MIYYSHVNEDSTPERSAFSQKPYKKLVCIAGSGERVVALLDNPCLSQVEIVDNNLPALHLTELKLMAIKHLDINEYLTFIRFNGQRSQVDGLKEMFNRIAPYLSDSCYSFWTVNYSKIKNGPLLNTGHFEKFLSKTRLITKLMLAPNPGHLLMTPFNHWNQFDKLRWSLVLKCFGLRWSYRILGLLDKAFVDDEADVGLIPKAIHRLAQTDVLNSSFFMHLIIHGNLAQMQEIHLPRSLRSEVLNQVKLNLWRETLKIEFIHNDILAHCAAEEKSDNSEYSFYSLSDLVSCVSPDYVNRLLVSVFSRNPGKSSVMLRSFLKNRHLDFISKNIQITDYSHLDSTLMYKVLHLEAATLNQYANQHKAVSNPL